MDTPEKSKLFRFLKLDVIVEHLTGLIETKLELVKLEVKEEVAKVGARIIAGIVLAFLLVMIIIFLSVSLATLLNSVLESLYWGYFIITGFYLLVLILLIVFKAHIRLQQVIEDALIDTEDDGEEA